MARRRDVVAGMAALPLVAWTSGALAPVFAQEASSLEGDRISTSDGDVTIHPVSHASLLLGYGDEVIYVDPVGGAEAYADLPAPTAILITHGHGDHFNLPTLEAIASGVPILTTQEVYDQLPAALQGNATALANGDEGAINDVPVLAVTAYNTTPDRLQYHPQGVGNGYVLTFGDKLIYVAGDTEPTPEMLALENIAVAFLPMNLPYTMTVEQAAEAVNTFKPTIVYPYHHRGSDLDAFEAAVEEGIEVRRANWYPGGEGAA